MSNLTAFDRGPAADRSCSPAVQLFIIGSACSFNRPVVSANGTIKRSNCLHSASHWFLLLVFSLLVLTFCFFDRSWSLVGLFGICLFLFGAACKNFYFERDHVVQRWGWVPNAVEVEYNLLRLGRKPQDLCYFASLVQFSLHGIRTLIDSPCCGHLKPSLVGLESSLGRAIPLQVRTTPKVVSMSQDWLAFSRLCCNIDSEVPHAGFYQSVLLRSGLHIRDDARHISGWSVWIAWAGFFTYIVRSQVSHSVLKNAFRQVFDDCVIDDSRRRKWRVLLDTIFARDVVPPGQTVGPPSSPIVSTDTSARAHYVSVLHVLVLVDIWGRQGGGIPVFNEQFCRALSGCTSRGRKIHVTCVCIRGLAAGVVQQSVGDTLQIFHAQPRLGVGDDSLLALVDAHFLDRAVCQAPVSLVIGHDRFSGAAAITVAQNLGCQSAYFVHTNPLQIGVEKGADYHGHDKHESMLAEMSQANMVVFVGNTIHEFDHRLPSSFARLHFNPGWFMPPADVDREWPPCLWAQSTATPRSISVAGRVYDESVKGINRAVEITRALVRSNVNARIVLIGGAEDDMRTLRNAFESAMHPPSYVTHSGNVSVIYQFYLNSVCVLCPSLVDSFGLVAAEAFGAGVPVLVSTRTGVGQYLVQLRERIAQDPAFLPIRHAVFATIDLMVVDGSDDTDELARMWIPRVRQILDDPESIRHGLNALKSLWPSWEASVQALCNEGLFAPAP